MGIPTVAYRINHSSCDSNKLECTVIHINLKCVNQHVVVLWFMVDQHSTHIFVSCTDPSQVTQQSQTNVTVMFQYMYVCITVVISIIVHTHIYIIEFTIKNVV